MIATPQSILQRLVRKHQEDAEWHYADPATERSFSICRSEGPEGERFMLAEFQPNGIVVTVDARGNATDGRPEPRLADIEAAVGPNGLVREARRIGIDVERVVFVGGGYGVDTVFLASLEACAQAIASAISENVRYSHRRELTDQEKLRMSVQAVEDSKRFWAQEERDLTQAEQAASGLFKGCYNLHGPLDDKSKTAILSYLNQPTQDAWLAVRDRMIVGHVTLWQAWCEHDRTAPRAGRIGYPQPEVVREAIRAAVDERKRQIAEKKAELPTRRNLKPC